MKENLAFNKMILVSQRYCNALFELSKSDADLDIYLKDLLTVQETLSQNAELVEVLGHPIIPKSDKKEIIDAVFKGKISENILNFVQLLIDRNRMFAFNAIVHLFKDKFNQNRNIMTVEVVSAIEINEETKAKLIKKLETLYQRSVSLDLQTDKEIIAGMILKIGDNVIDGSIKTKLEKMKRQLI